MFRQTHSSIGPFDIVGCRSLWQAQRLIERVPSRSISERDGKIFNGFRKSCYEHVSLCLSFHNSLQPRFQWAFALVLKTVRNGADVVAIPRKPLWLPSSNCAGCDGKESLVANNSRTCFSFKKITSGYTNRLLSGILLVQLIPVDPSYILISGL